MISWDDLRHLEAFERLGSAPLAGRELGVAASTVYRRIAALEASVGFPCLVRGRGITPSGRELATFAREAGSTLSGIAGRARAQRDDLRGAVRLTATDGFAPLLVAPLAALAAAHPNLRVDVHVSDNLSLRKRQADVALSLLESSPGMLVGRKLFAVRFAMYGTRELASDPERARWIVLGPPMQTSWLGAWEREHAPADRIALATASRRLLVDMVVAGAGIGLLPAPLAASERSLVEIKSFSAKTASLTRPAWLLTHPDVREDARVRAVMKVIAQHLRKPE